MRARRVEVHHDPPAPGQRVAGLEGLRRRRAPQPNFLQQGSPALVLGCDRGVAPALAIPPQRCWHKPGPHQARTGRQRPLGGWPCRRLPRPRLVEAASEPMRIQIPQP